MTTADEGMGQRPERAEVAHHLMRMADANLIVRRGEQPVMLDGRRAADLVMRKLSELTELGLFDWWPDADDDTAELGLLTRSGAQVLCIWDDELFGEVSAAKGDPR